MWCLARENATLSRFSPPLPLLPQRVGAHRLQRVEFQGPAEGLHPLLPHRQGGLDTAKLGWKITVLEKAPSPDVPAIERRRAYDTTQPGQHNTGHRFGDALREEDRMAVIEYLKTL